VTKGLACEREVILFDNAGIGSSTGDTPRTVAAMTKDCVDFCRALDLMSFDVMGFSLGGMIAQQLAQDHPDMIRRIILLDAGPRGGQGMTNFRPTSWTVRSPCSWGHSSHPASQPGRGASVY
jgi:pimeloyl-ACP methyl ester carboxylesterase